MSEKKKKNSIHRQKPGRIETNGTAASPDKSEAKRAIVLGTERRNRKPLLVFLVLAVALSVSAFYMVAQNGGTARAPVASAQPTSTPEASQVTYPVTLFEDGQARHFQYDNGGSSIKYFVIKSADGVIRAAFDACDVCWPAGKGYYQDGDHMVCRNCGRRFASVRVNEVKGGCNPAPLFRKVEGDQLVIEVEDILDGKSYFNFSDRA